MYYSKQEDLEHAMTINYGLRAYVKAVPAGGSRRPLVPSDRAIVATLTRGDYALRRRILAFLAGKTNGIGKRRRPEY